MRIFEEALEIIRSMRQPGYLNYCTPGLASRKLGGMFQGKDMGTVRMFEASVSETAPIIPHSHRYDFACLVLEGWVDNTIWTPDDNENLDMYQARSIYQSVRGQPGCYEWADDGRIHHYSQETTTFTAGDWYAMEAEEIHSIKFGARAKVLFFQGPDRYDRSVVLQPVADGLVVPTFAVQPWMFELEKSL